MPETLKSFMASVRKPMMIPFGMFPSGYDLSWIETVSSDPPFVYAHPTTLIGDMDGVNDVFTLSGVSNTPSQIALVWNGLLLTPTSSYIVSDGTITMQTGYIPESGDSLIAYVWS